VGVCSCFVPYSIDRVHEGIRAATASSWCLWECLGESGGLVGVFWVSLIWELVLLLFFQRPVQGIVERVVIAGQFVLLHRDGVWWHHEPM
jgi:hypothetical protein